MAPFDPMTGALLLQANNMTGPLPTTIGLLKNLGKLLHAMIRHVRDCPFVMLTFLSVASPNFITHAVAADLLHCDFSGTIPSEVGLMTVLSKFVSICFTGMSMVYLDTWLMLSFSAISTESFQISGPTMDGTIPTEIGQLTLLGACSWRNP